MCTLNHLLCLPFPLLLIPFLSPQLSLLCVCLSIYVQVCVSVSVCSSVCPSHWVSLRVKLYPQKKKKHESLTGDYPLGKLSLPVKGGASQLLSLPQQGITGFLLWQLPLCYFSHLTLGNFVSFSYNALQLDFPSDSSASVPVVLWVGCAIVVLCLGVADILKVMT